MRVLQFRPRRQPPEPVIPAEHLTASEVAAYIDRSLTGAARERAERHLSDCSLCRDELVACARLATEAPAGRRTRFVAPIIGVAAAAVIVAVAVGAPRRGTARAPTTERASGPVALGVAIVAPRDGASIESRAVRFIWRADSGAVGYRVIVTAANGTLVWKGDSPDTTITPPRTTMFVNGGEFNWRVESTRADGGAAWSQTATFRVQDR